MEASGSFLVSKVDDWAKIPYKASARAAGYDLSSVEDVVVGSRARGLVSIGLKMRFPEGTYGRLASRSGLAVRHGIEVGAGVIDPDYTGVVKVLLHNHSDEDFAVKKGDRIAQLVLERCANELSPVEAESIEATGRGQAGFGSTGK